MVLEYYLVSHNLSWKISTSDFLSIAIIFICTYAIFYEIVKKFQVSYILWKSFGVSMIAVLIAGIFFGIFAFIYISQWHPEYTQKMINVALAQGGPYTSGAGSAGVHLVASITYSSLGSLLASPILFMFKGILSGLIVAILFIFRRYRLTRYCVKSQELA